MGFQLNIKSAEAYKLASEIAEAEGRSRTQVVLEALRAHYRTMARERKIEELMAFVSETATLLSPDLQAFDIDRELYDDKTGLPK